MKSVLLIGLGRFGRHMAAKLQELHHEVLAVDKNEERVNDALDLVTHAQIGDSTSEAFIASLGVRNFDMCVVCIGTNFQSSLEITSLLKELGANYVISKATRDVQAKFLLRNGADEVIYPERDIAERLAVRVSANHVFDYIEMGDYGIYEIPPRDEWLGKSIKDVNFRVKYHVSIIGTKENGETNLLPSADHIFKKEEHLMIIGKKKDVDALLKNMK